MDLPTVLMLFGGESSEHDVSIASARNVFAAVDNSKFDLILGYIDRHGKWWLLDRLGSELTVHGAPQIAPVLGSGSFVTFPNNRVIRPDVILPILHGKNGEDGSVQGLAQLLHIPIVGCDMTASAICMDKRATKSILHANGIKIAPYEVHRVGQEYPDFNKLSMALGSPLFVKPSRAGSSVGVSKVYSEDELIRAINTAHEHDDICLIEAGINGKEIEVAMLGNLPSHQASIAGEVKPEGDFYSYDSKYAPESTSKTIIPADLESHIMARVQEIAKKAYELTGCRGLARVDFFIQDDGTIYLNEINTIPGFTNISMYAKLWRAEGVSYAQLIERLIFLALDRTINEETEE
jgi:D-alanine-D-alanine ligase